MSTGTTSAVSVVGAGAATVESLAVVSLVVVGGLAAEKTTSTLATGFALSFLRLLVGMLPAAGVDGTAAVVASELASIDVSLVLCMATTWDGRRLGGGTVGAMGNVVKCGGGQRTGVVGWLV